MSVLIEFEVDGRKVRLERFNTGVQVDEICHQSGYDMHGNPTFQYGLGEVDEVDALFELYDAMKSENEILRRGVLVLEEGATSFDWSQCRDADCQQQADAALILASNGGRRAAV